MRSLSSRRIGILLVASSATLWSTSGLFVRMAGLDGWTILLWRSVFAFATLAILAGALKGRALLAALRRLGPQGLVSVFYGTVSTIAYIFALNLTTVANVMTLYATMPFVVTVVAFFWLHEHVTKRFVLAGLLALGGVAVMAGASASGADLLGMGMAVLMTVTFALLLVHAKRHPGLDMTLTNLLTGLCCVVVALPMAETGLPAPVPLLACALFGILASGVAYAMFLSGGRRLPSGEAGLISLIDVVLGPLWMWLVFGERPGAAVLAGVAVVLGAVLWYVTGLKDAAARSAGDS